MPNFLWLLFAVAVAQQGNGKGKAATTTQTTQTTQTTAVNNRNNGNNVNNNGNNVNNNGNNVNNNGNNVNVGSNNVNVNGNTILQPLHVANETNDNVTGPVLTNAVTDWLHALDLAVDTVISGGGSDAISNHHHARWMGLTSEAIFRALSKNNNRALTDDAVASYAAHQFLSYNFPQMQSGYFDPLLNVYLNYFNGTYPHRAALDSLVLPVVKRILVRETGRGMQNFVQHYPAPNTIGTNQSFLRQYQGQYQFTDLPGSMAIVSYRNNPVAMPYQQRGHFGTIKPYFQSLSAYSQGVTPRPVGSAAYNQSYEEVRAYGSNSTNSKDSYNWNTPFFWVNDFSKLPVQWSIIARANLPANMTNRETARFFAGLGLGIFECTNTGYGMKWIFNVWRPITAIRSGDTYGHAAQSNWSPQLPTPMHPEYVSGHCAHSGAAMEFMRLVLGKDNINPVVLRSDYNDYMRLYNGGNRTVPNRRFNSLTQIKQDVGNSRILGGVHWRYSCDDAWVIAQRAAAASHAFWYSQ